MPRVQKQVSHELGQAEAIARVRRFLQKHQDAAQVEGEWQEGSYLFKASAQGIRLRGKITVTDNTLAMDAKLPLIALPFAHWFYRIANMALRTKAEPEPASVETTIETTSKDTPTLLFLHIPKAAGTTLAEYIYQQCKAPGSDDDDDDGSLLKNGVYYAGFGFFKKTDQLVPAHVRSLLGRPGLRAVIGHFSFGLHEFVPPPYRYITLLRDPVDRAVSLYYYVKAQENISMEAFFSNPAYRELDNDQTRRIAGMEPALGKVTREHLEIAKRNLEQHFTTVGVTERFDEFTLLLKHAFGWKEDFVYFPRNVTRGRPGVDSVPPGILESIKKWNQLDAELHQYAARLMDRSIERFDGDFAQALRRFQEHKRQTYSSENE